MNTLQRSFLYATIFTTGALVLVIEIAGARLISPFFGSTIFVWSSLISVTLGFLALGYWIGGKIADAKPKGAVLYTLIAGAGTSIILLIKLQELVLIGADQFGLRVGPLVAAILIFAIPLFLLGSLSPFVIRLLEADPEKSGSASGRVFALSTVGSLLGAVVTGFFLIPLVPISLLFVYSGILLLVLAIIGVSVNAPTKRQWFVLLVIVLLGVVISMLPTYHISFSKDSQSTISHSKDSFYTRLGVLDFSENGIRCLLADGTTQSCINVDTNKSVFAYIEESVALTEAWHAQSNDQFSALLIGLGAGDYARSIPREIKLDIAEIDPLVVQYAKDYFDFSLGKNQELFVDDARHFLRKEGGAYDFMFIDVYSGNTQPIHLLTQEFFQLTKKHLNEDGVLLANINATSPHDPLLTAAVATIRSVFPSVTVSVSPRQAESSVKVYLVQASQKADYQPIAFNYNYVSVPNGRVVTDGQNPMDIMQLETQIAFRDAMKATDGYKILLQ